MEYAAQNPSLISAWFTTMRPKTLTVSWIPFTAGPALAYSLGASINWTLIFFSLLSAFCIQTAVNLINDAYDRKKKADTAERLGPLRVLHMDMASTQQVYWAGMGALGMAFITALPLIIHGGIGMLVIVLISMLCAYIYTGGPFPLAYNGLGDLFVLIFYGWISTMVAFWLQAGKFSPLAFLLGTQIGFLSIIPIAINNLRDVTGDTKANKRTLAVRFGITFGRFEIATVVLAAFLLNFVWFFAGYTYASALPWLVFPLGTVLIANIFNTEPSREYNKFLGMGALLHLCFGTLLTIGFLLN